MLLGPCIFPHRFFHESSEFVLCCMKFALPVMPALFFSFLSSGFLTFSLWSQQNASLTCLRLQLRTWMFLSICDKTLEELILSDFLWCSGVLEYNHERTATFFVHAFCFLHFCSCVFIRVCLGLMSFSSFYSMLCPFLYFNGKNGTFQLVF